MVSWSSAVVLVLMILVFGFYFDIMIIALVLAAVIFLMATAGGMSKAPRGSGGRRGSAQPVASAPAQLAQPQQPQVVVIKQPVKTETSLKGWKPTWYRSPIPITVVPASRFDPLWKKVSRSMGGLLGKGIRKMKDGFD